MIGNNGSIFNHGLWIMRDLEILDEARGVILKDQNGDRFRLTLKTVGVNTQIDITKL